jgi:hypothetical protein
MLRTLPPWRASHREIGAHDACRLGRGRSSTIGSSHYDTKQYEHSHRKIHVQAPIDEPVTQHPHSHLPQFTNISAALRVAAHEPAGSRSGLRLTRSKLHRSP